MSGYRNGAAVDADNLFDTDIVGDGPQAENFRLSNGVGLKYAAAPYGTPGSSFGYRNSAGVDNGPRWTTRGTANYTLPINGREYGAVYFIPSGTTGYGRVTFQVAGGNTYAVLKTTPSGTTTLVSGALPAGAVYVRYTFVSYVVRTGDTDGGGSVTNPAASATAIGTGTIAAFYQTAMFGSAAGSKGRAYTFKVEFLSAASVVISTSTITMYGAIDGS